MHWYLGKHYYVFKGLLFENKPLFLSSENVTGGVVPVHKIGLHYL